MAEKCNKRPHQPTSFVFDRIGESSNDLVGLGFVIEVRYCRHLDSKGGDMKDGESCGGQVGLTATVCM